MVRVVAVVVFDSIGFEPRTIRKFARLCERLDKCMINPLPPNPSVS